MPILALTCKAERFEFKTSLSYVGRLYEVRKGEVVRDVTLEHLPCVYTALAMGKENIMHM